LRDNDGDFAMPPKNRVGLDTRNTALPFGTGVASYAVTLAGICQHIGFAPKYLTTWPVRSKLSRFAHAAKAGMKIGQDFSAPDIYRVAQCHFNLYRRPMRLLMDDPPELMHWTYPLPLFIARCKNIVTVHDLIPLHQPQLTGIDGDRLRRLLRALFSQFDGIVTVSEAVRREIIHEFGVPSARVETIYPAADLGVLSQQAQPICPPGSFIMAGSVEARKNIRRVIAAYKRSGVTAPLVIIGPDGEGASAELAGMGPDIIRIPYVSRGQLLRSMQQARAILFPSLAEGFGLPIVEAFALGVPVMTSLGGATEEIAGGAALLVNPHNLDDITEKLRLLADDNEICGSLAARGLARSAIFSVDAYAGRLSHYYQSILNS
jgi:glycosyltransferase involved in cell wall biosynthesis